MLGDVDAVPAVPHARGLADDARVDADGPSGLHTTCHELPGALVLTVAGDIDLFTCPEFTWALLTATAGSDGRRLVVDLDRLDFLGGCGTDVLRCVDGDARRRGDRLRIVVGAATSAARRVARTVRLGAGLPVLPSVTVALAGAPDPATRSRSPNGRAPVVRRVASDVTG